jgi:uncharacterized ferredoxin-like protein
MVFSEATIEKDAAIEVAKLMIVAAKTAPKGKGVDCIATALVVAEDLNTLADKIEAVGQKTGRPGAFKDAASVRKAQAVVLLGLKRDVATGGIDCGACGFETCQALQTAPKVQGDFTGPSCAIRLLDLGIALGAAVKIASILNMDNRIMANIGIAAKQLKTMEANIIHGIPLSISSKNVFFDRK